MLFNSYIFIIFFVFVLIISRRITSWRLRKFFLLISSYIFYAAWNPPFIALLLISTVADWVIAHKIHLEHNLMRRKIYLTCSLIVNLGLLGYFKYGGFIVENFVSFVNIIGLNYQPAEPNIILPVGISFYTFQTLSYSLDIYRQKAKPWSSFLDYALYVSFFPQLVAGPIVRAVDFLPQCVESKKSSEKQASWGLILFTIGVFNKVVIADTFMAPIVETIFNSEKGLTFFQAWAGAMAFSVQIFCDFAGYSTCAIGVALVLGFILPDNFRFPYGAIGFSDFWRRWHISLSTWLRDYLYISLGGNRKGMIRTYVNIMLTMLIGGLWHGASWLFVIWGGIHGLFLVFERLVKRLKIANIEFWGESIVKFTLSLITYSFICISWVFFRATDLNKAWDMVLSMIGVHSFKTNSHFYLPEKNFIEVGVVTGSMLLIHWFLRDKSLEEVSENIPWGVQAIGLSLMVYLIIISMAVEDRAFIYFQF